jgi:quercetin dioxygenase-like cupin family protein
MSTLLETSQHTGPLTLVSGATAPWFYLNGDKVATLFGGAVTSGRCEFVLAEAGDGPPLHAHAQSETFVVLEGTVEYTTYFAGVLRTETIRPGDSVYVPGHTPHRFSAGQRPARSVVFLTPTGHKEFFHAAGYELTASNHAELEAQAPDYARVQAAAQQLGVAICDPAATYTGPSATLRRAEEAVAEARRLAGELACILQEYDDATGALLLVDALSQQGAAVPLHAHSDQEVMYVAEGEYEILTRDADGSELSFRAPAGSAIFIPGGAPHGFRNIAAGPSRLLAFFNGTTHKGFFVEASVPVDRTAAAHQPFEFDAAEIERIIAIGLQHGLQF